MPWLQLDAMHKLNQENIQKQLMAQQLMLQQQVDEALTCSFRMSSANNPAIFCKYG